MATVCTTKLITPAVPGTAGTLLADFNLGWSGSAQSIDTLPGSGYYQFTPSGESLGIVSGLTSHPSNSNYFDIEFGFYINKGKVLVIEDGGVMSAVFSAPGSVLKIERRGNTIEYSIAGTLVYTSLKKSSAVMVADVSFYSGDDTITAASIVNVSDLPNSFNDLASLTTYGGDGAQVGSGTYLQPLVSLHLNNERGSANLAPLTTEGGSGSYTRAKTYLAPMITDASFGMIAPTYSVAASSMLMMHTITHGITDEVGTSTTALKALRTLNADHAYGEAVNQLEPLGGMGGEGILIAGFADLTLTDGYSFTGYVAEGDLNRINATLPKFTLEARTGHSAKLTAPKWSLSASSTTTIVCRAELDMPLFSLAASGHGGSLARATLSLGTPTLRAFAGSVVKATLHDGFVLTASGTQGSLSQATVTMPMFTLEANITSGAYARANLTMPMLRAVPSGKALLTMPGFGLVAIGHAVVATTYEAYAMTMQADNANAVTRYTNYPFNQILRFENKYFGFSDTAMYLLGGDTDNGTAIAWDLDLAITDMNTNEFKRVVASNISGSILNPMKITLSFGSGQTYDYTTPRISVAQNYRQAFGKGIRARYVNYQLSDTAGQNVEIDSINVEHYPLTGVTV